MRAEEWGPGPGIRGKRDGRRGRVGLNGGRKKARQTGSASAIEGRERCGLGGGRQEGTGSGGDGWRRADNKERG